MFALTHLFDGDRVGHLAYFLECLQVLLPEQRAAQWPAPAIVLLHDLFQVVKQRVQNMDVLLIASDCERYESDPRVIQLGLDYVTTMQFALVYLAMRLVRAD